MAKEAPEPAEAAPAKSKKGLIIIVAAVVVALAIGVGVAVLLMKKNHAASAEGEDGKTEHVEKKKEKPAAPPVISKLDQFTVKLQPDGEKAEQYLQVTIELEMLDAPAAERVKLFLSKIRANILLILLGKKASDISTPDGVKKLGSEVTLEVNKILNGSGEASAEAKKAAPAADDPVQAANITQIIIQ